MSDILYFTHGGGGSGEQGPPGPGVINWLGAWSSMTTYEPNDAVSLNGSSYIATAENTNQMPPNATYWGILALRGNDGDDGVDGEKGDPGLVWRGAWDGATAYVVDDAVEDNGSSYVCNADHTDHEPPDSDFWDLLAAAGEDGTDGTSIIWQGAWNSSTTYESNDAVSDDGSSYICIAENTNQEPPNPTYWDLLAQKGDTGETGGDGHDGADGSDGTDGISFVWRGDWDDSTSYLTNDVVEDNGSAWIAIADNTNQEPPNPTYWNLLASKGDTGATGDAGADGAALVWQGAWSSMTSYSVNDAVSDNGSSYVCISAHTNHEPPNGTYWDVLAEKGAAGADGMDGADGADGAPGSLTPTTTKTANYTAANGDLVIANPAGGGFTVTLPTSPSNGWEVGVYCANDLTDDSSTSMVTVDNGTNPIHGYESGGYLLWVKHEFVVLSYNSTLNRWEIISERLFQKPTNVQGPSGDYTALAGDIIVPDWSATADHTITLPINQFRAGDRILIKCGENREAHPIVIDSQGNHILSRNGDTGTISLYYAGEAVELMHGASTFWQVISDSRIVYPRINVRGFEYETSTDYGIYTEVVGSSDHSITRALHAHLNLNANDDSVAHQSSAGTAVFGDAEVTGSDDIQHIVGVQGYARHSGTGNLQQLIALNSKIINDGAGTIDNQFGLFMYGPTNGTGVTNTYGIYINDYASYGSGDSYAIWSGNGPVRFGGTLTVDNYLKVNNNLEVNGGTGIAVGLGANTAPSYPIHAKSNGSAQVALLTSDQSATIVAITDSGGSEVDIIASSGFGHAILGNGAVSMRFGANGTPSWAIPSTGHWVPLTTATYDIGSSGGTIRDLFVGRNIYAGNLPTTDPSSSGEVYADRGILVQSGHAAPLAGGSVTILYTFSTTTTNSDPGNGTLRLDNATQNSATTIRADLLDANGADWTTIIDSLDDSSSTIKGYIRLTKADDPTKWLLFTLSAVDSSSGYRNITVANVASSASSPFSNSDKIILDFSRTGDKGTTGTTGTTGLTGPAGKYTPTATKTSAYTAVVNDLVIVDATSGTVAILCPASPSNGDSFAVFAVALGTNAVSVTSNTGQTFDANDKLSGPPDVIFLLIDDFVTLTYNSNRTAWEVGYKTSNTIVDVYNPASATIGGHLFYTDNAFTWTKRTNLQSVDVYCIGGGGGGGGGRLGATGGVRGGGGAGGPGSWMYQSFPAAGLTSSISGNAGAGGDPGAGQTSNSTNGGAGGNGGNSSFGNYCAAFSGTGGAGGTTTGGTGGAAATGFYVGNAGGNDNRSGGAGTPPTAVTGFAPNGGGGGGGIQTGGTVDNGSAGGTTASLIKVTPLAGGTAGTGGTTPTNGGDGTSGATNEPQGGAGGGGGGSGPNNTTAGGKDGGKGGLYGGGGGGGGSATNGSAGSGWGGTGGPGVVIVINYF